MVIQQVYFVHVQQATVGRSQDARLKLFASSLESNLNIECANDPVFGSANREIHKARAPPADWQTFAPRNAFAAVITESLGALRITTERAIGHHLDLG
jgi:hypothetical protein